MWSAGNLVPYFQNVTWKLPELAHPSGAICYLSSCFFSTSISSAVHNRWIVVLRCWGLFIEELHQWELTIYHRCASHALELVDFIQRCFHSSAGNIRNLVEKSLYTDYVYRWTTNIIAREIISNHIFHLCGLLYSIMWIDREEIQANWQSQTGLDLLDNSNVIAPLCGPQRRYINIQVQIQILCRRNRWKVHWFEGSQLINLELNNKKTYQGLGVPQLRTELYIKSKWNTIERMHTCCQCYMWLFS